LTKRKKRGNSKIRHQTTREKKLWIK